MKTSLIFAFLVMVVLGSMNATSGTPQLTTYPSRVFLVEKVMPRVGTKAVDFTWKDGGKTVAFSEFTKGKVVLLNLWATWCGPCKRELPDIVALSGEMAAQGVVVVGVSLDQKEDKFQMVKTFCEKMGIPYLNVIDNLMIADGYGGVQSIPTTFIIDRQGNVVQRITGMQSKETFVDALKKAL
ncbi:MAG: TlpA disulfide reductase family protein [Candidatus Kapabacteria bacterium]|nr:TlpA disulfide reductase family protein [Candidatus Kapabacteria bacterium]